MICAPLWNLPRSRGTPSRPVTLRTQGDQVIQTRLSPVGPMPDVVRVHRAGAIAAREAAAVIANAQRAQNDVQPDTALGLLGGDEDKVTLGWIDDELIDLQNLDVLQRSRVIGSHCPELTKSVAKMMSSAACKEKT